ncbi:hypothetical protein C6P40_002610 [Pichia californica]|uniref:Uncharacterized protein n=1 Tax=Pichia californica TaxID=460514 RepID=A0A9P6WR26_9ASCO|nr:hypothetical protein C6P40_002610 [[Candida] californica]
MFDLISLFNKRKNFIDSFTIIIIDSFSILNSNSIKILKNSINNNSINEPIIRFYQSMRKFFHIMQKFCSLKNKFIFTTGGMEIFNQRIIITNDNDDFSDNEDISLKSNYINQQILVPTISLKSDINSYFNNRIIIYRDWVMENSNNELISGLNNSNPNIFQESINLLNSGNLKCLPHFLCIDNNSNNSVNESPQSGYFLIDNNFNIVDIESNVLNSDVFVDNDDDDIEIPDSQEW